MRGRSATGDAAKRRLLGGLMAVSVCGLATGCERSLSLASSALAGTSVKTPTPTPLEPAKPPPAPKTVVGATFGRVVLLEGVTIDREMVKAGDDLRIWLHWQSVAAASEDWRSIGRLVTANGRVIASEDDQVGGRRRHLTRWQMGERVVDEMRLRVIASCPPGEYGLFVGVLRPDNQTTVPITGRPSTGSHGQEDAVLVGTVEVVAA